MPPPKPFIPVSGARHRFTAVTSGKTLGDSKVDGNTPGMKHAALDDDTLCWYIKLRTDAPPATYELINAHDGLALECFKGSSKVVRARWPESESRDNQSFTIVPAQTPDRAGQFQLRCMFGSFWLSSNPFSTTVGATEDSSDDHTWWTAAVEPLTFHSISYDLSDFPISSKTKPDILSSKTVRNKSKSPQTASVTLHNRFHIRHTMTTLQSIEAAVPSEFEAAVPTMIDGDLTTNAAETATLSMVKSTVQNLTWNETVKVNCDPDVSIKVAGLATQIKVAQIPYIAKWQSLKDPSREFTTVGSYSGELWHDFQIEYTEADI